MNGLNPGDIPVSFDSIGFQQNQPQFNDLSFGSLNDFEKKELLDKVQGFELSNDMQNFINEYNRIFGERDIFLWKWLGPVYRDTGVMLSTVDKKYVDSITDEKILVTMIAVILDDIADIYKDKELLESMSDIFRDGCVRKEYENNEKICFVKKAWEFLINRLSKYPNYAKYKDMFIYDFKQLLNCVDYSYTVNNNPNMLNSTEAENYDCHNMIVFLLNGIDLMASPDFNEKELSHIRKAFWYAQQMARIGNWLSTWKREVKEKDYCSGVFAYIFEKQIIDPEEINSKSNEEIIEKIEKSGMKQHFLKSWMKHYQKLASLKDNIKSANMDEYLVGLQNVIKYHIASEGLK